MLRSIKNILLTAVILSLFQYSATAQTKRIDSLWAIFNNKAQSDTNRLKAMNDIAWFYIGNNPDTTIILAEQQLKLAIGSKAKLYEAKAISLIGVSFYYKGNFQKALEYYLKAVQLFEEIKDKKRIGACYTNIGVIYKEQANYPQALDYYLKALKICEEIKDNQGIGACYNNIGVIYKVQSNFPKSLEYYQKSLKINEEIGDKKGAGACYMNIGSIYKTQTFYPKALEYYFKALQIREEIIDKKGASDCYSNIGIVYHLQSKNKEALDNHLKSLLLKEEIGDRQGVGTCYINLSELYNHLDNYKMAILYGDSGLQICKEIGDIDLERFAYQSLATASSEKGKYKEAYEYHIKFKKITDSIFNIENSKQLSDMKTKFEVEKKEAELIIKAEAQQAVSASEKKKQQVVIYTVACMLVLVFLFAIFIFNRYKVTQKQKHIIEKQKEIVEEQKHLVEEKQKEIVDSITYAKRLQQAILPSDEELKKHLPDNFLLYKPKDIVAGDFYWMEHLDEITYIAAADSTGHGVPGAMVSVVCSNALNRAVKEFGLRETGKILDKTRELVLETFAKSTSDVKDGMDISLLAINKKQIFWSGANNQLWYISGGKLTEIKSDKQPIGKTDNPTPFTTHTIGLKKDDIFYLMTDGFPDQFGGSKGKKFKYKQLEELLLTHHMMSLSEQKNILESSFNNWKGNLEQVDDVTLIGIKI